MKITIYFVAMALAVNFVDKISGCIQNGEDVNMLLINNIHFDLLFISSAHPI